MRIIALAFVAALAACAVSGGEPEVDTGPSPFPVARGTAPPPPAGPGRTAPPQGQGAGGLDFGQWRNADPTAYAAAFQTQVRSRYAERSNAQIRTDLEANGFLCEDERRLDCRIEIMERQCAYDWYVVVERGRAEPIVGYDVMCLGAR